MGDIRIEGSGDPTSGWAKNDLYFCFDPYRMGEDKHWLDEQYQAADSIIGTPTYNAAGYYEFDGTNDALVFDMDSVSWGSNTGMVEALVWADNTSVDKAFFSCAKDNDLDPIGWVGWDSSYPKVLMTNSAGTSDVTVFNQGGFNVTGEWQHWIIQKTGAARSTVECYINGTLVTQNSGFSSGSNGFWWDAVDGSNPSNLTVGAIRYFNGTFQDWDGRISRVAVWNNNIVDASQARKLALSRLGRF